TKSSVLLAKFQVECFFQITSSIKLFLNLVPKKMLVFHGKNAKIGFVEIVSQKVLNKIIHFIVQTLNF
ncbi:hypothetical protein BpHYR1_044433, partial [Brachionus plicatilis]